METILKLEKITKSFTKGEARGKVLDDISIEIKQGEFFVLVGPSGSGKSTLLRIMSGLEHSFEGLVSWRESIEKSDISFVFQEFAVLPWLTVAENIELPLLSRNILPHERGVMVRAELVRFGLEKHAHRYSRELSGGLKQRVGIARAFITKPKIIFMDEPFSELDSFTALGLRRELLEIWRERNVTVVMVTHIVAEALELADRVAVLTARPARLEAVVENTLTRPRNLRGETFFALEDKLVKLIAP